NAREATINQLAAARAELQRLAPQGAEVMNAEREQCANKRQLLHARGPHLAAWQASGADLDRCTQEFQARAQTLQQARKEADRRSEESFRKVALAKDRLWQRNETA